jgi:hypothetical protein
MQQIRSFFLLAAMSGVHLMAQTDSDPLAGAHAELRGSLTFHASFDDGLAPDFSEPATQCQIKQGAELVAFEGNEEALIAEGEGKFGAALHFPKKGVTRPQYADSGFLGYNETDWSGSVSAWLRISPDEDLEPGYCDPIQITGDDSKKGFIFLEWSRDERPRYFRYAIRPLFEIWNPNNEDWATMSDEKRPMVQLKQAPFSRERWTHVVFTFSHINHLKGEPSGQLYLDGERVGSINDWNLTFGWDPARVQLVLGASYVGYIDDLAVFNKALTGEQVQQIYQLPDGIRSLFEAP